MKTREGYNSELLRNKSFGEILSNLTDRQSAVYNLILEFGPISTEDVAKILDVYPNYITGRVKELRDLGVVEFDAEHEGKSEKSNKKVSLWKVKKWDGQLVLNF
jgi:predicted transcriptional regulator